MTILLPWNAYLSKFEYIRRLPTSFNIIIP